MAAGELRRMRFVADGPHCRTAPHQALSGSLAFDQLLISSKLAHFTHRNDGRLDARDDLVQQLAWREQPGA